MTEREWIRMVVQARRERRAALRFAFALALEARAAERRAKIALGVALVVAFGVATLGAWSFFC